MNMFVFKTEPALLPASTMSIPPFRIPAQTTPTLLAAMESRPCSINLIRITNTDTHTEQHAGVARRRRERRLHLSSSVSLSFPALFYTVDSTESGAPLISSSVDDKGGFTIISQAFFSS